MQKRLVFVPIGRPEVAAITAGDELIDRRAFTVTPELMRALDYGADHDEDAEYAAMVIASVAGLSMVGERLVLVAEVDPGLVAAGEDADNGECRLVRLPVTAVTAFFSDEDNVDVTAAARASAGRSIDEAWECPEVQDLLADSDLLWHSAEELPALGRAGESALPYAGNTAGRPRNRAFPAVFPA